MITRSFGKLEDGRSAGLYILHNNKGMEAHVTDYGAALVRLIVPDKDGNKRDVVLGYDDAAAYEKGGNSFGGTVGRVANRISNASFDLNGRHYILTANDGPNCLHGGRDPFVHRLWSAVIPFGTISTADLSASATESMNDWSKVPLGRNTSRFNPVTDAQLYGGADQSNLDSDDPDKLPEVGDSVKFMLDSPDGDQGFPGSLHIEVTYTLTNKSELHLDYNVTRTYGELGADVADSPQAVPLNLTNHSYFNLNGHNSGTVLTHEVQIDADWFTESDRKLIPTGALLEVSRTPMDFRTAKTLGQDIGADYEPLKFAGGYDHNYVLSSDKTDYREVGFMYSKDSGIKMTILTDLPGMQLYTSNFLDGEPGKDGAVYAKRSAACFETQFWPDTINKPHFPGGMVSREEPFISRTTYRFSIKESK